MEEEASFDLRADRYADVNYYSEASTDGHSCDGDADDDSFISAEERLQIGVEFVKLSPSVDATRRCFDRLLRVCDGEDEDDASFASSSGLLSIASHDVPDDDEDDDDLSYASFEQIPILPNFHPILTPRLPSRSQSKFSSACTNITSNTEEKSGEHSTTPCPPSPPQLPALDEITDSSTLTSNQDFSINQSSLYPDNETVSPCQEIEQSIELIQSIKTKLRNLRQLTYTHSGSKYNRDSSSNQWSLSSDPHGRNAAQRIRSESKTNHKPHSTQRLNEIRSRLRSLEKFSTMNHSTYQSLVDAPCKQINSHVKQFFKSDSERTTCQLNGSTKTVAMISRSHNRSSMFFGTDNFAQTLMRISRELMLFLFILSCLYLLYMARRDSELNALQVQLNQVKMFERALTIVHERQLWRHGRRSGPLRRFFLNSR